MGRGLYATSQYQFGSEVTSASFAFNWSRGRGATLTCAAQRYSCCVYTEQALILSDVTTKLLVTWIIVLSFLLLPRIVWDSMSLLTLVPMYLFSFCFVFQKKEEKNEWKEEEEMSTAYFCRDCIHICNLIYWPTSWHTDTSPLLCSHISQSIVFLLFFRCTQLM